MADPSPSADLARDVARMLLRIGAVAIDVRQPFVYASGITSPVYTDNRLLISYPDEREQVVEGLARRIVETVAADGVDVVAGTATAGIAWAAWVAARLRKPMIYVRSAAKEHGRGRQIEGLLEAGQRVVVIEDHVSTGGSSLQTVEAIRRAGGLVSHCFAISTYELRRARDAYARSGVTSVTLSSLSTLLDVAVAEGWLGAEDRRPVEEWLAAQSDA
jgi:orotate phosphoribosyltransferase